MRNSLCATPIVAILLVFLAPALAAKPAGVTLAELVQQSSVIVLGRIETDGKSVPKPGSGFALFKTLRVLKGNVSLGDRDIQLCNSPPPMAEYPDPSRWAERQVVLFLSEEKGGCFEYSHTTTSVLGVSDGRVTTAAIADQPTYQHWDVFLKQLHNLVAKQGT